VTDQGGIHDENPFQTPINERDPVRRLRGRLAAPVTIVTAGGPEHRAGLTVSSLMVAEGDPARLYFLVGSTTDLYYAIEETGRFVVHICEQRHRDVSDVFAGLRPSPGGAFAGLDVEDGPWGPVIGSLPNRAYCTFDGGDEETYSVVADGIIDRLDLDELDDPLVYFRGRYRDLEG
jgi:3-hydroxy-9,10-secoandrosta-1,3,5(10)-triene-9,17-dione monooxygenase reductase component